MKWQLRSFSWALIGRFSTPLLIMGVSLWILTGVVDPPLLSSLPKSFAALPSDTLLLAGLLCGISFWAVARYDGLAHCHFRTGVDPALARKSGFAAIAVAQTAGFGIFTGAAVRWRMLPHIGFKGAMRLSVFVSVTFMTALAFLCALACLILPAPDWTSLPALLVATMLPVAVVILSFTPALAPFRHYAQMPSLHAIRNILAWAGLDILAAAGAFYLLIPAPELGFSSFLPVFMLAIGAAMLSGAPGGVGPFELTLISLLPQVPTTDLVTAILVFRAFYYAFPAVLAVATVFLTKQPKPEAARPPATPSGQQLAEHGILAQNAGHMQQHDTGSYALWFTPQTATMLFDPATGQPADALAHLKAEAKAHARSACVYKCSARTAVAARAQGWHVAQIAQECVVDLSAYDLDHASRRGLRRKLRKAQRAGLIVERATALPLREMAAIDTQWQQAQGSARGGTMGRFCQHYLAVQDVFLARQNGRLIAYASFHNDPTTPCLDLMRQIPTAPDGTMHLLIHRAIDAARSDGKSRLSLAAIPQAPEWVKHSPPLRHAYENPGLRQFKASFAPLYLPRYAAAPSKPALVLGLIDIASEVHHPRALPSSDQPHEQHEDYEVALNSAPWKGR